MGGIIDHSSNLPDPIALSSAEVEYNQACLAIMAATHVHMILQDLEHQPYKTSQPLQILLDSKIAIAIGTSFKDIKHTCHILCQYHYVWDSFNN